MHMLLFFTSQFIPSFHSSFISSSIHRYHPSTLISMLFSPSHLYHHNTPPTTQAYKKRHQPKALPHSPTHSSPGSPKKDHECSKRPRAPRITNPPNQPVPPPPKPRPPTSHPPDHFINANPIQFTRFKNPKQEAKQKTY